MKKVLLAVIILALVLVGAMYAYQTLSAKIAEQSETASESETAESITLSIEPETSSDPGSTQTSSGSSAETSAQAAPDFAVLDGDGNTVKLSDMTGKPVVINFWATWCGPCKYELPSFDKAYQTYGEDITFMMVNLTDNYTGAVEDVKDFVSENGYTFPVYYDTESSAATAYEIYSIPLTVYVDAEGNLISQHIGAMSEDTLVSEIEKLLP